MEIRLTTSDKETSDNLKDYDDDEYGWWTIHTQNIKRRRQMKFDR